MHKRSVVIVGGGPVGMMLALQLDMFGVDSVILNTEETLREHPKGSTHNSRTMEHFRRLGLSERIRALGLPADYPTDVGYFTRWSAWELARLPMPSEQEKAARVATANPTDQVVEPILRCNQMYVEREVFEHLRTRPHVEVRFGWHLLDFSANEEQVTAEVEHVATGRRETLVCEYLVGCDGGHSTTRRKLGVRLMGEGLERQSYLGAQMMSARLRAPDLIATIPHPKCWQYWTVNATLRSNLISLNGRDEFVYMFQLEDCERPDVELIGRRFTESLGKPTRFEVLGHSTWIPGQALVAERYTVGRVHLCGDSAHLFTPTGGFGLNTGIDDAVNLGWKLAASVKRWGGPKLAATYEIERRPIGLRNTGMAKALTRNVGRVPVTPLLEEDTPEGAAARAEVGCVLLGFREEYASIGIQLGARYDGSPIIAADGTSPPPDDPARYVPSACPGGRAPHLWLPDRSSLFDRLGIGFTLLRLGRTDAGEQALARAARERGVPLEVVALDMPEARELYARNFAIIRPDHYVAWRGDEPPDDCDRLWAQLTGA